MLQKYSSKLFFRIWIYKGKCNSTPICNGRQQPKRRTFLDGDSEGQLQETLANYYPCSATRYPTLRELYFHFLPHWMGYDRGGGFPFDFEHKCNSIWLRKSKGKLSSRSYPIQFERKWKYSFLSVEFPCL